MIIFYYTLHDHFFSGVSLLVQDSEIAESQGIASPKQDDTPARVSDHLQAPQDARRRASTGSSPISEAGSTGTLDTWPAWIQSAVCAVKWYAFILLQCKKMLQNVEA